MQHISGSVCLVVNTQMTGDWFDPSTGSKNIDSDNIHKFVLHVLFNDYRV